MLTTSTSSMLASVGFLVVPAAVEGFFGALPRFTAGGWLAIVFIGVGSGAGYHLWLWWLAHRESRGWRRSLRPLDSERDRAL